MSTVISLLAVRILVIGLVAAVAIVVGFIVAAFLKKTGHLERTIRFTAPILGRWAKNYASGTGGLRAHLTNTAIDRISARHGANTDPKKNNSAPPHNPTHG